MAAFDLPEMPQTRISPSLMVGAASPLWAYFGAAAAGGVAYWWMTQWVRPVNLEAMMAPVAALPIPVSIPEPAEVLEAVAEFVADAAPELPQPVGGEAAPVSPILEVAPEPMLEAAPEPVLEPVLEATPEPVIQEPAPAFAEPAPKLKIKKAVAPLVDPEA